MGVLGELARRQAFGDLAALARAGIAPAEITGLCEFGKQLLELDAEDFGIADASVPKELVTRARQIRMPQDPKEVNRGALGSLRPAFSLLLEAIAVRWNRQEMGSLVATVHIASEYLAILAWEPVLGHAADPAHLGEYMRRPGSRYGVLEEADRCDHTRGVRAACDRSLRVAGEQGEGWRSYLDRAHSQVADGLGACATDCRTQCTIVTDLAPDPRKALVDRCYLAKEFAEGALVRLRHAAPVGHGFGVPSAEEVLEAWTRSHRSLSRREIFKATPAVKPGYPLPDLPRVFSAIAGVEIGPSTLLRDVSARLETLLADR